MLKNRFKNEFVLKHFSGIFYNGLHHQTSWLLMLLRRENDLKGNFRISLSKSLPLQQDVHLVKIINQLGFSIVFLPPWRMKTKLRIHWYNNFCCRLMNEKCRHEKERKTFKVGLQTFNYSIFAESCGKKLFKREYLYNI